MVKKKRRLPVPKKGSWIETRIIWRDEQGVKHSRYLPVVKRKKKEVPTES